MAQLKVFRGGIQRQIRFLLFVGFSGFVNVMPMQAQISPGKLSQPHAFIDGMTQCLQCHTLGAGLSVQKCLSCHKEIQARIKLQKGFHHTVVNLEKQQCKACHSEHAGLDFDLIAWPNGIKRFKHDKTGYSLEGKHKLLSCRECHKPALIRDNPRKFQKNLDLKKTFLGLRKGCTSCHADEHRKQLSKNCRRCHNEKAWKPASSFNHNKARFRLTGKHRVVSCAKCHLKVKDRRTKIRKKPFFVKYVGLQFRTCENCHRDVHRGEFRKTCENCHRTTGWKKIKSRNFDHSLTRFPLRGLHGTVACEKCHRSGDMTQSLKFSRCDSCHQDAHDGQFVQRSGGGRCESCHNEQGFLPALFSAEDHQKTRFPLTGAHLATACTACHKLRKGRGRKPVRNFLFKNTKCQACHEDVHLGQFDQLKPVKSCQTCHIPSAWSELLFKHNRDSRFILKGAHNKVSCDQCHKRVRFQKAVFVLYRPINPSCKTCHSAGGMKLK